SHEHSYQPVAAFDAAYSALCANRREIGAGRKSLQFNDFGKVQIAEELGKSTDRHQLSLMENSQPIAQLLRLFQIMRRVQDRVALISEAAHYFQNFLARLRIDTRGRLVEQNQLGSMNQRDREVKAAFHAARVGGDAIVAAFVQPDE